ncbi:MAG TPA: chemotaxis protein CheB [Blastocatellia bacterium]|nr:chemotaxis protein CheB [Blastocatellia bacterium]
MRQIRVVVADSSPFVCRLLKTYLESVPDICVLGVAQNGQEFLELVERQQPDVVTLGMEMPDMTGLEALKVAQQIRFTPAIVISGANMQAAALTLEALQYGALDFICKYTPGTVLDPNHLRQEIITKIRLAAVAGHPHLLPGTCPEEPPSPLSPATTGRPQNYIEDAGAVSTTAVDLGQGTIAPATLPPEKVIVIGASTGGPVALQQLLSHFPEDFTSGILVVQHLPAAFTAVLAEQLQRQLALRVKEAVAGDRLERAVVLITPGGVNLQLKASGEVQFSPLPPTSDLPSINLTMQSVAAVYGTKTRGVLLTGTGQDGGEGLAAIRQHGGVTFVQTPETCLMKGMPLRAIEAGVVDHVASPQRIARLLLTGV